MASKPHSATPAQRVSQRDSVTTERVLVNPHSGLAHAVPRLNGGVPFTVVERDFIEWRIRELIGWLRKKVEVATNNHNFSKRDEHLKSVDDLRNDWDGIVSMLRFDDHGHLFCTFDEGEVAWGLATDAIGAFKRSQPQMIRSITSDFERVFRAEKEALARVFRLRFRSAEDVAALDRRRANLNLRDATDATPEVLLNHLRADLARRLEAFKSAAQDGAMILAAHADDVAVLEKGADATRFMTENAQKLADTDRALSGKILISQAHDAALAVMHDLARGLQDYRSAMALLNQKEEVWSSAEMVYDQGNELARTLAPTFRALPHLRAVFAAETETWRAVSTAWEGARYRLSDVVGSVLSLRDFAVRLEAEPALKQALQILEKYDR